MSTLLSLGSRLKVGTRVAIGFASVLLLLCMVPGFDYYGLNAGGGCVKRFDRVSNAYAEVSKLQNALEQMRRSVILYGQNGAPELVNEVYKF